MEHVRHVGRQLEDVLDLDSDIEARGKSGWTLARDHDLKGRVICDRDVFMAALRFRDCSRCKHLNGQCTNGRLRFATRRSHIKVHRNGVWSWTEIALQ